MVHLPNEIWQQVISHCNGRRDVWLSLRHVNNQLKACVEQHFAINIMPHLSVALPIQMPTYDARNPIRGLAAFHLSTERKLCGKDDRAVFDLKDVWPDFARDHLMGRWAGMNDVDGGRLRASVQWNLTLDGETRERRLKKACAVSEGVQEGGARMEFEWKGTLTGFYV